MRQKRFTMVILALLSACAMAVALAIAIPALAQQAQDNASGGKGDMPVSFLLDSAIDAHEQDIKERMFEYKFEAASGNPDAQVALVKERSDELKNDTASKKGILKALMARNGSIPGKQLAAIVDEMSSGIEKLGGWSKKLEEHAAGLVMLNGQKAYTESIVPLMDDLEDARELASKASKAAKDKKNDNASPNSNAGQNSNAGPKK